MNTEFNFKDVKKGGLVYVKYNNFTHVIKVNNIYSDCFTGDILNVPSSYEFGFRKQVFNSHIGYKYQAKASKHFELITNNKILFVDRGQRANGN